MNSLQILVTSTIFFCWHLLCNGRRQCRLPVFTYIEIPEAVDLTVTASLTQAMTCNNTNDAIISVLGTGGDGNLQYYFAGDDPSTMTPNTEFSST